MKQYNVNVICKNCHRTNVLEIFQIVLEDEVTKNTQWQHEMLKAA